MTLTSRRARLSGALIAAFAVTATLAPSSGPQIGAIERPEQPQVRVAAHPEPVAAASATAARSARRGRHGYVLATRGLVGHTPRGLHVWVHPRAEHRADIAKHARATVRDWRRVGIKARYRGFGKPKEAEGVVTISEGPGGCQQDTGRVGVAWQSWQPLGRGKHYVHSGRVVICPQLYNYDSWQWESTVRHELGHVAGLGHFDGVYENTTQVMRSANYGGVSDYQAGDINGLRFFARNNARVKALIPPKGRFATAEWVDGDVQLSGSAQLAYYKRKRVRIVVTDNNEHLLTARTRRNGTFTVTTPWGRGEHKFCLTAVSPVNRAARTALGCATFSG